MPRYSVDRYNRLTVKSKRKKVNPRGSFAIEKNNALVYWLNEPLAWRREFGLPNKIRFRGTWQLDANHDLELLLDKTDEQPKGERLTLKGDIVSVGADEFEAGLE